MKILKYQYSDPHEYSWKFDEISLGMINLFVSNSGMGKTRLLNTIFNLGSHISAKKLTAGEWKICLEINNKKYRWNLDAISKDDKPPIVKSEFLSEIGNDGSENILISRSDQEFFFKGDKLPKLSKHESSLSILQDESEINPIFTGFRKIVRRRFFEADLSKRCEINGFPFGLLDKLAQANSVSELYPQLHDGELNLNAIIYILNKKFIDIFNKICLLFKSIFPFIYEIKLLDLQDLRNEIKIPGQVPIFCIKEKGIDKWILLNDLSSGMQKVLLILVDIFTLPEDSIYLVDEYENSLGVNAINFFPNLLIEEDFKIQFFVTSHHPYIINKIPIENWYVFHRKGSVVKILSGENLKSRIGVSKQQAFINLLNDPFFLEGIE